MDTPPLPERRNDALFIYSFIYLFKIKSYTQYNKREKGKKRNSQTVAKFQTCSTIEYP